jgi:acyl-CoA thioesterase I
MGWSPWPHRPWTATHRTDGQSLPKFSEAVRNLNTINIVAIGSSSTKGDGAAGGEAASYPNRLSAALAPHFPEQTINVLNLGIGGQEAPDEAARFKIDVLAKNPRS